MITVCNFFWRQLRTRFTVDDYSHYLFTPRDLTNWCLSLLRYDLNAGAKEGSSDHVLEIWAYEARRLFRDRVVGSEGQSKFDSILMSTVRADWSANIFDNLDSKLKIMGHSPKKLYSRDGMTIFLFFLCGESQSSFGMYGFWNFYLKTSIGSKNNKGSHSS